MKCIILAAGYATRLYPLTENFPKPLLKIGDKTILDWLIDDIDTSGKIDEYIVISNHKFAHHFEEFAKTKTQKITVVDDGTETNETRLGAVKDLAFAIDRLQINDDALVIAGDNVLDFSLNELIAYGEKNGASALLRYYEESEKKLLKCGVVEVDADERILSMTEKSPTPKTHFCTPPFYYYKKEDLSRIGEAIADGCPFDAPGSFAAWLAQRAPVYAMIMPGKRYDVGNLESYETVKKEYRGITRKSAMKNVNLSLEGAVVLVTGAAGFIGANLAEKLLKETKGVTVVGVDNMNDYYDVSLKEYRLAKLETCERAEGARWIFRRGNIADKEFVFGLFSEYGFDLCVNLAAQAGVRYSIDHPDVYIESNLIGFYNILEACRKYPVKHLVFASSSSVYGSNEKVPYSTDDKTDSPVSLYAATKKSNELLAHAYAKLYNVSATGLRFFTVYGPAGRPDMAYFGFTDKLRRGETIRIFNYGNCKRDFTYVDDIVEGILRVAVRAPEKKNGKDGLPIPPFAVYNIGNSSPENLLDFVSILSEELVRAGVLHVDYDFEAHKELVPMQPGDVPVTYADTAPLEKDTGFRPNTPLREGLRRFAEWYAEFYNV